MQFISDWWAAVCDAAALAWPWAPAVPRPWVQRRDDATRLVVFLHGIRPVARVTARVLAGVAADAPAADIYAPEFCYQRDGLAGAAATVAEHILAWRAAHPAGRVLVVGHSMGGRVAVLVERLVDVDAAVTCGAPLQGAALAAVPWVAPWFLGAAAPLTPLLARTPACFTCVWTWTDHAVQPPRNTALVGAARLQVHGTHWGMPRTDAVRALIKEFAKE
jgi:pimeloyl-ACP methyl ester carboxylesterase